jgi:hypothetical protein
MKWSKTVTRYMNLSANFISTGKPLPEKFWSFKYDNSQFQAVLYQILLQK